MTSDPFHPSIIHSSLSCFGELLWWSLFSLTLIAGRSLPDLLSASEVYITQLFRLTSLELFPWSMDCLKVFLVFVMGVKITSKVNVLSRFFSIYFVLRIFTGL